jgi:hypothetical protein
MIEDSTVVSHLTLYKEKWFGHIDDIENKLGKYDKLVWNVKFYENGELHLVLATRKQVVLPQR